MPATAEQWTHALQQTYWITPRTTSPFTSNRTPTRTEAPTPVSAKVLDKIREGHEVIARADRLAGEGTPLAIREAAAIRDVFVMETEELTGDTVTVRTRACPACGCYTLLPVKGKAQCINRHCAPRPGLRRRWTYRALVDTTPARPRGVQRSDGYPADLRSIVFLTEFFAQAGHAVPAGTLGRWVKLHNLPHHKVEGERAYLFSLSDVATVHAAQLAAREGQLCGDGLRPACSGLADLFYNTEEVGAMDQKLARRRIAVAKELCGECPFVEPCREAALKPNGKEQHGVAGGLTRNERRDLKTERNR
jgi:hypothetical protein